MSVTTEDLPRQLAKLAVGRASLEKGMATAQLVDDREWIRKNKSSLELYNISIDQLKQRMTRQEICEAREITNAPI